MTARMVINLPVKDLGKSVAFFKALGFAHKPKFTVETAACMVFSDEYNAMLLRHSKFKEFARPPMADAHKTTEVLTCPTFDDTARVDRIVDRAIAAGGSEPKLESQLGSPCACAALTIPTVLSGRSCGWTRRPRFNPGTIKFACGSPSAKLAVPVL